MGIRYPIATVKFSDLKVGDKFYFLGSTTYLYLPEVHVKTGNQRGMRVRDKRKGIYFDSDILVRVK